MICVKILLSDGCKNIDIDLEDPYEYVGYTDAQVEASLSKLADEAVRKAIAARRA